MNSIIKTFTLFSLLFQPVYFYGDSPTTDTTQDDYDHIDNETALKYFLLGLPTLLTCFFLYRLDGFRRLSQQQSADLIERQNGHNEQIRNLTDGFNQHHLQIPNLYDLRAQDHRNITDLTDRLRILEERKTKPRKTLTHRTPTKDNVAEVVHQSLPASRRNTPPVSDGSENEPASKPRDASPESPHGVGVQQPTAVISDYDPTTQPSAPQLEIKPKPISALAHPARLTRRSQSWGGGEASDNSNPSMSFEDLPGLQATMADRPLGLSKK